MHGKLGFRSTTPLLHCLTLIVAALYHSHCLPMHFYFKEAVVCEALLVVRRCQTQKCCEDAIRCTCFDRPGCMPLHITLANSGVL